MGSNYKSSDFKKLLDKLQQESWQLELIISGFAIYGLFQAVEPIEIEILKSVKDSNQAYAFFLSVLSSAMNILIFTLLIHVILRGLWIGTLGLRYISDDINYENLGYSRKFTTYLKKNVGSFDRYIARLENICSTLFALAYLLIFYTISFFTALGFFMLIIFFIDDVLGIPSGDLKWLKIGIIVIYFLALLVIFIDFLGAGLLKKYKWTSKLYFPLYKFFGVITLAFLYRPLVYNFLDQKKAKWLAIIIMPTYMIIGIFSNNFANIVSNYQIKSEESTSVFTSKYNYEDLMTSDTDMVQFVSIPSKVISVPYLNVFVGFNDFMEELVFKKDSTLRPESDKRGYSITGKSNSTGVASIFIDNNQEFQSKQKKYLQVINELYQLKIDTITYDKEFHMTNSTNGRFGFETFLDINDLPKGKHMLRLIGSNKTDSLHLKDTLITIPFWYFPQNLKQKMNIANPLLQKNEAS